MTNTVSPTNTPAPSTSTGFLSPSANAAQTSSAGDNNGYQTSPANAYANDSSVTTDTNSGTNTNTSCTNNGKDKHRYYNYNLNIPATAVIKGIQVRLDARADATSGSPKICVQTLVGWRHNVDDSQVHDEPKHNGSHVHPRQYIGYMGPHMDLRQLQQRQLPHTGH